MDNIIFELSDEQTKIANEWMEKRIKYAGAIGGQFTYKITPTSLGLIINLTDDKESINLTDYDLW